ncbi:hypothetical protein Acr_00g0056240 [Actinidia rufa]|uniref:Uncharacterized protein n=1 Tax=Actinidia rufa TaxID=165716 RepID=A0A7J0DM62_9ERIC|nr:hypothetical protein Acr_00g0056240 [Actinidia rufa]
MVLGLCIHQVVRYINEPEWLDSRPPASTSTRRVIPVWDGLATGVRSTSPNKAEFRCSGSDQASHFDIGYLVYRWHQTMGNVADCGSILDDTISHNDGALGRVGEVKIVEIAFGHRMMFGGNGGDGF